MHTKKHVLSRFKNIVRITLLLFNIHKNGNVSQTENAKKMKFHILKCFCVLLMCSDRNITEK